MELQSAYTIVGIISATIGIIVLFGGFFVIRGSVGKTALETQQSAIGALQAEMATLRNKTEDQLKEIIRLQHIIDTICSALKSKGIIVSIDGELVQIRDNGSTIVSRIQE